MRFVPTGGEPMKAPKRPMIGTREVCRLLGICRSTLDRIVRQGRINPARFGSRCLRYDPAAIDEFIEEAQSEGRTDV